MQRRGGHTAPLEEGRAVGVCLNRYAKTPCDNAPQRVPDNCFMMLSDARRVFPVEWE